MKTYSALFALDVPHYGAVDIEAADDAAAIETSKACDVRELADDPDWNYTYCKRIVHIEAPDGSIIASDVPLDAFHLRTGGDEDRRLCEAAPELLAAIRRIAAIPLWGESIPPGCMREDYAGHGEYDLAEDSFEPNCDTESTLLRDAVEDARLALLVLEGRGS